MFEVISIIGAAVGGLSTVGLFFLILLARKQSSRISNLTKGVIKGLDKKLELVRDIDHVVGVNYDLKESIIVLEEQVERETNARESVEEAYSELQRTVQHRK